MTRSRLPLLSLVLLAAAPDPAPAADAPLRLWYEKPAATWVEALPIGDGRLGAMVFGDARRERLALNEDTLWSGGPRARTTAERAGGRDRPDVPAGMGVARRRVLLRP